MSNYLNSAPDQIICIECGETILYVDDPENRRKKLYPVRCEDCVQKLYADGVSLAEGYSLWDLRYVL